MQKSSKNLTNFSSNQDYLDNNRRPFFWGMELVVPFVMRFGFQAARYVDCLMHKHDTQSTPRGGAGASASLSLKNPFLGLRSHPFICNLCDSDFISIAAVALRRKPVSLIRRVSRQAAYNKFAWRRCAAPLKPIYLSPNRRQNQKPGRL